MVTVVAIIGVLFIFKDCTEFAHNAILHKMCWLIRILNGMVHTVSLSASSGLLYDIPPVQTAVAAAAKVI